MVNPKAADRTGDVAAPRRGRPRNDPRATRDRLLRAAEIEFGTHGFHGTDTNKIARAAGVGPATFYRHYDDKLSILLEVYARWVEREWEVISQALERPPAAGDPILHLVDQVLEHHGRWRVVRASIHALVAVDDRARAYVDGIRRAQIDRFIASVGRRGSRAELGFTFLAIERANNALVDGDLDALHIDREQFRRHLADTIRALGPFPST